MEDLRKMVNLDAHRRSSTFPQATNVSGVMAAREEKLSLISHLLLPPVSRVGFVWITHGKKADYINEHLHLHSKCMKYQVCLIL